MRLPYIERIWRVKPTLELDEQLSPGEVFARLDPLLQANGTSHEIAGDTLTYTKDNPAAQDKMATFTSGTIKVRVEPTGSKLLMDLKSPALFYCFLAPFLFLAFGQATVAIGQYETAKAELAEKSGEKDKKKDEVEKKEPKLNPIDEFLGAPAPEKPDKDKKEKKGDDKYSPTTAYVLASLFAFLYLVGRVLEPWLLKRTFRKAIAGELESEGAPALDDSAQFSPE